MKVFEAVVGGYEAIISSDWDEGDIQEFEQEIDSARDLVRLAEQNTVLRVVDSGFDGIIADMKGEISPITSNIFRIIEWRLKCLVPLNSRILIMFFHLEYPNEHACAF